MNCAKKSFDGNSYLESNTWALGEVSDLDQPAVSQCQQEVLPMPYFLFAKALIIAAEHFNVLFSQPVCL